MLIPWSVSELDMRIPAFIHFLDQTVTTWIKSKEETQRPASTEDKHVGGN